MFTCELCEISTNTFFKKYLLETASVFSTNYEDLETPINTIGDYLYLLKIYGYWLRIPGYYSSSFLHFIIQIHLMTGNVMDENQISTQIPNLYILNWCSCDICIKIYTSLTDRLILNRTGWSSFSSVCDFSLSGLNKTMSCSFPINHNNRY